MITLKHFGRNPIYWGTGDNLGAISDIKKQLNNDVVFFVSGVKGLSSNSNAGNENVDI